MTVQITDSVANRGVGESLREAIAREPGYEFKSEASHHFMGATGERNLLIH